MRDFDGSLATLADEIGGIRARIAALKAQENALRAEILARVEARSAVQDFAGTAYGLRVVRRSATRIDARALPEAIRSDPSFYKTAHTVYVTSRPLRGPQTSGEIDVIETRQGSEHGPSPATL